MSAKTVNDDGKIFLFARDGHIMWIARDDDGDWWHVPFYSMAGQKYGPYTFEQAVALARLMS